MKPFWYAILDRLLGGWLASGTIPAETEREPRPAFHDWARNSEHFQQVKVFLPDQDAWFNWFHSFTPDALIEPQPERESELFDAPASFPCVVVATRRLGSGLVRADFYWDFVYPADFPAQPDPIYLPPLDAPLTGTPGERW